MSNKLVFNLKISICGIGVLLIDHCKVQATPFIHFISPLVTDNTTQLPVENSS